MKGSMQCVKQKSKAIIWIEGGKDYPTIEKCRCDIWWRNENSATGI